MTKDSTLYHPIYINIQNKSIHRDRIWIDLPGSGERRIQKKTQNVFKGQEIPFIKQSKWREMLEPDGWWL